MREQFWQEPAEVHISHPMGQSVQLAVPPRENWLLWQATQRVLLPSVLRVYCLSQVRQLVAESQVAQPSGQVLQLAVPPSEKVLSTHSRQEPVVLLP